MYVILCFNFMKICFLDVSFLPLRAFQCLLSCDFYCDGTQNQVFNPRGPVIFTKLQYVYIFFLFKTKVNWSIIEGCYIFITIRFTYIIYFDTLRFALYKLKYMVQYRYIIFIFFLLSMSLVIVVSFHPIQCFVFYKFSSLNKLIILKFKIQLARSCINLYVINL